MVHRMMMSQRETFALKIWRFKLCAARLRNWSCDGNRSSLPAEPPGDRRIRLDNRLDNSRGHYRSLFLFWARSQIHVRCLGQPNASGLGLPISTSQLHLRRSILTQLRLGWIRLDNRLDNSRGHYRSLFLFWARSQIHVVVLIKPIIQSNPPVTRASTATPQAPSSLNDQGDIRLMMSQSHPGFEVTGFGWQRASISVAAPVPQSCGAFFQSSFPISLFFLVR
jgi:hypothetical protein